MVRIRRLGTMLATVLLALMVALPASAAAPWWSGMPKVELTEDGQISIGSKEEVEASFTEVPRHSRVHAARTLVRKIGQKADFALRAQSGEKSKEELRQDLASIRQTTLAADAELRLYLGNKKGIEAGVATEIVFAVVDDVNSVLVPPVDEDPVDEDPVDEDPVDEDPVDEDPVDEDPVDEDPVDEEPVDEDPVDEDPVDEDPVDEDPVDEDPVDEDPVDEDPVDEEPVDEDPVDEDPVDEEPVDEDPVDEDPVDEDPVDEKPTKPSPEAIALFQRLLENFEGLTETYNRLLDTFQKLFFGDVIGGIYGSN